MDRIVARVCTPCARRGDELRAFVGERKAHRHYGQEIMACIVGREGQHCAEDDLRAFCEQHLGRYKTPKIFRFVRELPRGPSGKVQRLKLLDVAGC